MNAEVLHTLDTDLTRQDIQDLSSADSVAAFFARLGYNTDARTTQTAGNLGITADSTARPIKKIELIADQEGLLQVYLFELQSVTIAHTRALARAFRNRAGNYLLILTSDYERLDFVLLEKFLPADGTDTSSLGQKQVGIRPRILTVERLKPETVHLRVLRRLTWTESDPFGQYDKLLSAYALADWSEEYFNNRALFSDYYLKERLPEFPVWKEDPKPAYLKLREIYKAAASRCAGKERKILCQELVEPTLHALGFEPKPGRTREPNSTEPHYRLYSARTKDTPLSLCLVYPWDRSLDGKDDRRDSETAAENPGAVVVSLLEKGESPWVVVTNGRLWRLYAKRTHARATNYYEIDLDEVLSQSGPHAPELAESFRYFWLLFRSQAFELTEIDREGKKQSLSLLDQLLLYSEDYAKELGERLKDRVFEEIFPHLAAGFITFIRQRDGVHTAITQETLDTVYQGTLTLLYRLLFVLYSESRDLLPVKEVRGYYEASLTKLKGEIKEAAGTIEDEVEEKLKKQYREDAYQLYDALGRLFRVVDKGDAALNVPVYNGGLFLSDPEEKDDSPEAIAARFLNATNVPDRFLARAIDLLARDVDRKRQDLVFIDFKSLGVRQLGSIYEGLLEFKLRIADRKLAVVKEKGREVYTDFSKLDEKTRERAERQGRVKKKGQVYLENDKHERKATGSYYTPDHIVKYIIEHAVGPVLKEKFEAMRPKLREAQQKHRAFFERQEALRRQGLRTEPESKAEFIGQEVVDELFNIKILDPAMGSGHFLVEAVDYITDKTLDFLNAFPWNPVIAHLFRMRETILQEMDDQGITIDPKRLTDVNLLKRHVLKRCLYGVDINPMAVELAKVSLWLDCFTLGAPLSFLDHHLRYGNSLIGVTVEEVDKIRAAKGQLLLSASSDWQGLLQAIQGMIEVGGLPDVTSAQVARSRSTYKSALSNLENFKKILNVHTARWFVKPTNGKTKGKKAKPKEDPFDYILKSGDLFEWSHGKKAPLLDVEPYRTVLSNCARAAKEKRFFHWELEFPEVFYAPRAGTTQAIERLQEGGFNAVIGNPPYDVLKRNPENLEANLEIDFFRAYQLYAPALAVVLNLFRLFIIRSQSVAQPRGIWGKIIPLALMADASARGLRHLVFSKCQVVASEAFPQKDDENNRVFKEAKLSTQILICKNSGPAEKLRCRVHPGKDIEASSPVMSLSLDSVRRFDPDYLSIPIGSPSDVRLIEKLYGQTNLQPFRALVGVGVGEVDMTNDRDCVATDKTDHLLVKGAHIQRYQLTDTPKQGEQEWINLKAYQRKYKGSPKENLYKQPRVIFQGVTGTDDSRRLKCTISEVGHFLANSVNYLQLRSKDFSLKAALAFMNSNFLEWRFRLTSTNNNVNNYEIESLPIPRIQFNRPTTQRQAPLSQLVQTHEQCVQKLQQSRLGDSKILDPESLHNLLAGLCNVVSQQSEVPLDVLHDFVVYLADLMTTVNKEVKVEMKRFLRWLEKELRIQANNDLDSGIETLSGKTVLKNYLGNYRQGEDHAAFGTLWEIVRKNSGRLGRSLDRGFEEKMRQEHEKSLAVLLPLKQKLAATDWLIDQLVYRLYGLTEEEIAIVEGND